MLKDLINTIGSKLLIAVISLSVLLLNTNFLGASGVGTVGLLILGVSIFILICHFVNGGGLIYFASRYSVISLLLISYLWILLIALLFTLSITFLPTFLGKYAWDLLFLGIILAISSTNTNLLLGKEAVKNYNLCYLLQSVVQITALLIFYIHFQEPTVAEFIKATYFGYSANLVLSFLFLIPYFDRDLKNLIPIFRALFNYGFYLQIANLLQLFNYRLSYYLLQIYSGRAALGIYTSGVQLSEGILLPSKSLAMVQYSRISNIRSNQQSAKLSLSMLKLSFALTLPIILIALSIPADFFVQILGDEFQDVKPVIALMALGILALSMEGVLGRYFSGTGRQRVNTLNTAVGFVFTVLFGFWLIPIYGIYGAAITSSITYLSMLIFIFYQIKKKAELKNSDFVPNREDWNLLKSTFSNYLNVQKKSEKE